MLVRTNSPGPSIERSTWLSAAKFTTARRRRLGEQLPDVVAGGDVAAHEAHAVAVEDAVETFEVAGVGQLVEDDQPGRAVSAGVTDEVAADEAGAAGDDPGLHEESGGGAGRIACCADYPVASRPPASAAPATRRAAGGSRRVCQDPSMHDAPVLVLHDATVVKGGQPVLHGLRLAIGAGEHTAIIGPNGAGKSVLVGLLTHYERALAGDDGDEPVRVFGERRWNVSDLRTQLGVVSPALHQQFVRGNSEGRITGEAAVVSAFLASHGILRYGVVTDRDAGPRPPGAAPGRRGAPGRPAARSDVERRGPPGDAGAGAGAVAAGAGARRAHRRPRPGGAPRLHGARARTSPAPGPRSSSSRTTWTRSCRRSIGCCS